MTLKTRSLKAYILFWITLLALCMSALLTYQSTQYFLKGFDSVQTGQMIRAANLLPAGQTSIVTDFGYHVTRRWQLVPDDIKRIFPEPPKQQRELQLHFENWWYFAPPEKSYSLLTANNKAGVQRYISKMTDRSQKPKTSIQKKLLDPMVVIALWGIGSLIAFILFTYRVLSNLAHPIQALYSWAKALNLNQVNDTPPDFQYDELNQLAAILQESLTDVSERRKQMAARLDAIKWGV